MSLRQDVLAPLWLHLNDPAVVATPKYARPRKTFLLKNSVFDSQEENDVCSIACKIKNKLERTKKAHFVKRSWLVFYFAGKKFQYLALLYRPSLV